MNKLKDFLNKKKADKTFKQAGRGQTLSGPSTGTSGVGGSRSFQSSSYVAPADTADRRMRSEALADAINRRMNKPEPPKLSAVQRRIRDRVKQELEAEQLGLDPPDSTFPNRSSVPTPDERDEVQEVEDSDSTNLYTCELFEDRVLPKKELMIEIEKFLYDTLSTEPIEAATLMIHTLNPSPMVEQGIPILIKYLTNIVNAPTDPKFRRIKTSNKVFLEKIAPLKGGAEFLKAVGFFEDDERSADGQIATFLALPDPDEEMLEMLENGVSALEAGSAIPIKLFRDSQVTSIN